MRHHTCSTRLRVVTIAAVIGLGASAAAQAQTPVCLVAKPFTASGAAAGVPMWGYAQAAWTGGVCDWASAGQASSPGPRITVPPADASLTVYLKNELPVATSVIIPGLPSPGTPARLGERAISFTSEVGAGAEGFYQWPDVRPGTYLYQSGSHVQVQVQMGLYGAVTRDAVAGEAYAGKSYTGEALLFYSEIDPVLHQAVAEGKYAGLLTVPATPGVPAVPGTPTMTSTFNYKPRYFLVNGDAFPGAAATVEAGPPNEPTLIRFLNAGLRTHVPVLQNGDFELVAEDAHAYGYARRQIEVSLLAGKTMDVLWTPASAGTYTIVDRTPHLTTEGGGPGGMIARLVVSGAASALGDSYGARNDVPLVVPAPGVMANDATITTASVVDGLLAGQGTLAFVSDGSFTYTAPPGFIGQVTFTYQQPSSNVATVTINVGANVAPVALDSAATTAENTPVAITLQASDANSDPISYAITIPPANGTLSGTAPNLIYTPSAGFNGTDSVAFTASDGSLPSTSATVTITVTPVNDAPAALSATVGTVEDTPVAITLTGADPDLGAASLSFAIASPPANGTLSAITPLTPTTAQVTYTPKPNWAGTDSFRFTSSDGKATSPVATISIPVTPAPDNPIAVGESYAVKYNSTTTLNVLANDSDPDGSPLTINNNPVAYPKCFNSTTGAFVSQGASCASATGVDKVTINATSNRLTFVPNPVRRNRAISFTYQAQDSGGALSNAATVSVDVNR